VSHGYQAVGWSPFKRRYDGALLALLLVYLGLFAGATLWLRPEITVETLLIRAFGTAALLLLHVVLAIGPLARLDRRFLPLLYSVSRACRSSPFSSSASPRSSSSS